MGSVFFIIYAIISLSITGVGRHVSDVEPG